MEKEIQRERDRQTDKDRLNNRPNNKRIEYTGTERAGTTGNYPRNKDMTIQTIIYAQAFFKRFGGLFFLFLVSNIVSSPISNQVKRGWMPGGFGCVVFLCLMAYQLSWQN